MMFIFKNVLEGVKDMENLEIREMIKKNRLKHYEVADEVGISETRFSVWLRKPLSEEREERIINAILKLRNDILS